MITLTERSLITGRVEEWWKKVCQENQCEYYIHQDYPLCSYCTCPDNCIVVDKNLESEVDFPQAKDIEPTVENFSKVLDNKLIRDATSESEE